MLSSFDITITSDDFIDIQVNPAQLCLIFLDLV